MKIAVLSHFFPPEPCAAANRAEAIVKSLVLAGHSVQVITNFPTFPAAALRAGDRFKLARVEEWHGARVVRLLTCHFGKLPGAKLAHWLVSASAMTAYVLFTRHKYDAVLVTVPPITLAAPALLASRNGVKLILDVRDVFPDVAITMGEWRKDGFLARATEKIARKLYRRAHLIAGVTSGVVSQIAERGVDPAKLLLAPNGFDELPEHPRNRNGDGRLQALYIGNLGLATDVDVLIDAAALTESDRRIAISVIGGGAQAARVRERVRREGLRNITLRPPVDRSEAMRLLTNADVAIVPLRKGITDSIPTKIFDALSVGCPVVVCAGGEAQSITESSGGGTCVPAGDAQALALVLRRFAAYDPAQRKEMGARGRSFVRDKFSRGTIMEQYSRRIAQIEPLAGTSGNR